ncbi:hypothetical protein [Piscinibacter sp. XHJ-5]|uniref:hypothetical protein n=1 Tax=Piscinibacter sp. XHJ-5 TaxID=3037797 RepID=UPI002452D812|nr:hypothetical protein [Piscinibacter sp. XHJ-5]
MSPADPSPLPFQPRKLLLFSGHMTDAPARARQRFPVDVVSAAADRIASTLDALHVGGSDIALTQGAAGGDQLFVEACQARQVPVLLLQPLPEEDFIAASIAPSADSDQWRRRYLAARSSLAWPPRTMPASADDPFEACTQWLLRTALASGADELHLIALWNGEPGDGPGGTAHMVEELRRRGGRVSWIDTRTL